MMDFQRHGIPLYMREAIMRHVDLGQRTGDFLTAIFENNLVTAALHADETNIYLFRQYAHFLHGEMPRASWGSKAKVAAWIKHHGLAGLNNQEKTT